MLHSRTAFEDYPPPLPRRHLVRLWIDVAEGRPSNKDMDYLERGPAFRKVAAAV